MAASANDQDWLKVIIEDLSQASVVTASCSIYRTPKRLRRVNDDAYTPHFVSIGPFHYQKGDLPAMECHKLRYMVSLLKRTTDPVEVLQTCGRHILALEWEIRRSYAESIALEKNELARIMLLDGCFILELLYRYSREDSRENNDPMYDIPTLRRDLALLENQIPFAVLDCLFKNTDGRVSSNPAYSLTTMALKFFQPLLKLNNQHTFRARCDLRWRHFLDLLHKCYIPRCQHFPEDQTSTGTDWDFIDTVTALSEAGIKFKKGEADNLVELEFSDGYLTIPHLEINDSTDSLFRNLIAFEQSSEGSTQYVTSYMMLMDRLIDSQKDVQLLQENRIIENNLGGCKDVSTVFNNMCKQVFVKDFYFARLCKKVNAYYNKRWNRYLAVFLRDYCSNPWRIIALIIAGALLLSAILQTVYTMVGFYGSQH
ncbi:hypothetical protein CJ030_MR7G022001 [Morella rubra]|uniref:Uncharacterized protein n=1 Tax=Morella rubra TaxID=262757 RepID=A0A6A1UXX8_9ROSI|nr:hypothetical protein CJ030_MR7G022001 [Morella rubra]